MRFIRSQPLERVVVCCGLAVLTVATAFVLKLLLEPATGTGAPFVLFFGAVLVTSLLAGPWAGVVATLLSIPLGAELFVVRAGYAPSQAIAQAALFSVDCSIVVYLTVLTRRARAVREQLLRRERSINEQLRESEERFRLALEEAPIGMALVALDGTFVRVNGAFCRIVGYSAEELLRRRFQDITHPGDLDSDVTLARRLARGDIARLQVEKRYVRKDGSIVVAMLSSSILRDRAGAPRYYISQVEDITERKRADEALRFSEARFAGIISISADAIISIDEDHRITLYNDGAEAIFGYSRAEAIGAPVELLIPERLRASHRRYVAEFAAGRVNARRMGERLATIAGRRKSGEEFPAEAAISKLHLGDTLTLTVALRDVTGRRRIEREQRLLAEAGAVFASSLDYERTLAAVGELVAREFADWCVIDLLHDGDDGPGRRKVVCADPRRASLATDLEALQLDRDRNFLSRAVFETRRPLLRERIEPDELAGFAQSAEHLRLLRAIGPRSLLALPLLSRGELLGALILISSQPARVYGPDELHFAQALADRAALAIENGRLYRQSVQATRLREQVLEVVAHDLRNPLSAIVAQASSLARARAHAGRDAAGLGAILRAGERMKRLIQDLLDVTLIEAGHFAVEREPVAPGGLLADAVDAQRPLSSSESLELKLELEAGLPEILGDRHRLLQVLENLIGNAIKFTPPGGRIAVGARARPGDVAFYVADSGCGIARDAQPRVFGRFWQARKSVHGAGLGLPIARGIVEAHGGRIWFESEPGRGTTFHFTIPAAASLGASPEHAQL